MTFWKKISAPAGFFTFAILAPLICSAGSFAEPEAEVYLSKDKAGGMRADAFDCSDDIYIRADFTGLTAMEHEAKVVWLNPKGRKQDFAVYRFTGPDFAVLFWLKLKPGPGGKILSALDGSYGYESSLGAWTANFYLDGGLLSTKIFYVAC